MEAYSVSDTAADIDVRKYIDALLFHVSLDSRPPDHTVISLACTICQELLKAKRWTQIDSLFEDVFARYIEHYRENEPILRTEILTAKEKGNYEHACRLMEIGTFRDGSDLIKLWDDCRYEIQKKILKRPLTAVAKYRIRERFPPPKSICPSGVRSKHSLPSSTRTTLMNFFRTVTKFPSTEQKLELADKTALTKTQVHNWFANRRRKRRALQIPDQSNNPPQNGCHGNGWQRLETGPTNPLMMLHNAAEVVATLDGTLPQSLHGHAPAPNFPVHPSPFIDVSKLQWGSPTPCSVSAPMMYTAPNGRDFPHYVNNYYPGNYCESYHREGGLDYYRSNEWVATCYREFH